jgi:hypothetical protein
MPERPADAGIPTLTVKADLPPLRQDPPVLSAIASEHSQALPPESLLRATLHAEIEQVVESALDEAMAHVRERLEAELPDIVQRVMRTLRPG